MRTNNDPVRTVLTISTGFLALYFVTKWTGWLPLSLTVGLAGIFSPYLAGKIELLWMKLAWLLSLIVPNILLTTIFFLLLVPMSLLSKLFGRKDPLQLRNSSQSTYHTINKSFGKSDFEKPW